MFKRITIIEKKYLEKNGSYFNSKKDKIALINYSDIQLKSELENLNKNAKSRYYEIAKDYNLINKADIIKFITDYLEHLSKNEIIEIINNNFDNFSFSKLGVYSTKRKLKVDMTKNRFYKRSDENV